MAKLKAHEAGVEVFCRRVVGDEAAIIDQHVGALEQAPQDDRAIGACRVERDAALAGRGEHETAALDSRAIVEEWRLPSHCAAGARPLDQRDVRAEAHEETAAEGGRASVAEFDDADILQQVGHQESL